MTENVLRLVERHRPRPAGCDPQACRSMVRRDIAVPGRPAATPPRSAHRPRPGRIGAPTGPRNKLTSTKSLPAARGTRIRSNS